jgi:hypothetical protein
MNTLLSKEKHFLRLLLHTSAKQRKVLIQTIDNSQLRAIVQIVYNVLLGYRSLSNNLKKQLSTRKRIIRQFVSRGVSLQKRKAILLKYNKFILPFIDLVKSELV